MVNMSKIRLNQEQINYIKELSLKLLNTLDIWIFGSRTDLSKKGGDIDIYIKTSKKDNILKSKIAFLREFDKKFGEQKVDLLIDNNTVNNEIFAIAQKEGVKL